MQTERLEPKTSQNLSFVIIFNYQLSQKHKMLEMGTPIYIKLSNKYVKNEEEIFFYFNYSNKMQPNNCIRRE